MSVAALALVVVGPNLDEDWERTERIIAEGELNWAQVRCAATEPYQHFWRSVTGITSLPRVLVLDREGILRGDTYPYDLAALLRPYFSDNSE